jgi:hypothetical protein
MPIPKPNTGETRSQFMSRCVRFLADEGKESEQAIAICYDIYAEENKEELREKYFAWKTIDNKRRSLEPYAENTFYTALRSQLKQYLDEVKRSGRIDFELEGVVTEDPVFTAYEKLYNRIMPMFGKDTMDKLLGTKKARTNWRALVRRWFQESDTTTKITGVTRTTKKRIRKQVRIALSQGTSVPNFARQLSKDYGFSRKRAMMIGRTEMVSASNAGSLLGARESGVPTRKVWLSTQDDRTRGLMGGLYDHWSMEGTVVNLNDKFNVSGELMQFPGDSSQASPGNTINCRCTLIYEPILTDEAFDTIGALTSTAGMLGTLDDTDF